MITSSNKDEIYIGREAGREIHQMIKGARKSVKIVSPYLSGEYVKDLIGLHKLGVEVTLVCCDKIEGGGYSDFRAGDLVKKERVKDEKIVRLKRNLFDVFIWVAIGSLIIGVMGIIMPALFIVSGIGLFLSFIFLVISFAMTEYSWRYETIFRIRVFDSYSGKNPRSTELVHSKIFVIDEEVAFLGSVNFTYSGFRTHYESAIKVEDKNAVGEISREVERLYNSKELRAKDVEEWCGAF